MATVATCAGFGAVCGSSLATTATMTRIALPEMESRGYSRKLSTGSIAAGSTLGVIVPPSVLLVLYAILTEQFVTALFVAALGPAVIAVLLYMMAVIGYVTVAPDAGPAADRVSWPERRKILRQSWGVYTFSVCRLGRNLLGHLHHQRSRRRRSGCGYRLHGLPRPLEPEPVF